MRLLRQASTMRDGDLQKIAWSSEAETETGKKKARETRESRYSDSQKFVAIRNHRPIVSLLETPSL